MFSQTLFRLSFLLFFLALGVGFVQNVPKAWGQNNKWCDPRLAHGCPCRAISNEYVFVGYDQNGQPMYVFLTSGCAALDGPSIYGCAPNETNTCVNTQTTCSSTVVSGGTGCTGLPGMPYGCGGGTPVSGGIWSQNFANCTN